MRKRIIAIVLVLVLTAGILAGCGKKKEEIDPHEGQVYLYDGYDWIWYTPIEGLETNAFVKEDFEMQGDTPVYTGDRFDVLKGIDVSEHQLSIDWNQVGKQDLDFCYVRMGRRGTTEGGLFVDERFDEYMHGARSAGLKTGVYFYSQAVSVAEAIEEAEFVLDHVKGYSMDLPICYDWERYDSPDSRTLNIEKDTVTDCAVAFCEKIKAAGYEPIIYYGRITGYYRIDLSRLADYKVWYSLFITPPDVTYPSFYYHFDMWQYTQTGSCPGISTDVDYDYIFIDKQA